jgi:hypothetical protein
MKLRDFLFMEVIPDRHAKHVYVVAGATVGGFVFAVTQSWAIAITYDILTALACWSVFAITRFVFD